MENLDEAVKPIHIVFIIQLPKIAGGCQHFVGFQGGKWQSVHIDELLESNEQLPHIEQLVNRSVSDLFQSANPSRSVDIKDMDVDENLDGSEERGVETPKVKEECNVCSVQIINVLASKNKLEMHACVQQPLALQIKNAAIFSEYGIDFCHSITPIFINKIYIYFSKIYGNNGKNISFIITRLLFFPTYSLNLA